MHYHPGHPLPPPLQGLEAGSLAEDCIRNRLLRIGHRILVENDLPASSVKSLESMLTEIPQEPIIQLQNDNGPDIPSWNEALKPYLGKNWLEPPWFVVETYFYRRIISAINYFSSGIDPFLRQKQIVLEKTIGDTRSMSRHLEHLNQEGWSSSQFEALLQLDLWGNQVDLSLWSAEDRPQHGENSPEDYFLVDDRRRVSEHLSSFRHSLRIDFIIDNAAFELIGDLCLADYLLSSSRASQVRFHLKLHPTFVSDATILDVQQTIHFLQSDKDPTTQALGTRLASHLDRGRLQCHEHPFWTSLHYMWHMPEKLRNELADSHLVISKGDANYRRSLGDVHWVHETPVEEIVGYFPAPILFLRTCKSNLVAGLKPGQAESISKQDPEWLANGKWGLIQFID